MDTIRQEIERRIELRRKLAIDPIRQEACRELCRRDILYWFDNFAFTDRNSTFFSADLPSKVPMILFPYQREYILDVWDAIRQGSMPMASRRRENGLVVPTSIFSEKSRQMGFSVILAMIQVYAYAFHNMKSLYLNRNGDEVDNGVDIGSHFGKVRFILGCLPWWMIPKGYEKKTGSTHNKHMTITRADGTGAIIGKTATQSAGRGGTYNFVIFDEMAFMEYAEEIFTSVSSTTPCMIFNSTPNGRDNKYYDMRELAVKGIIRYHRCFYYENPYYTPEWFSQKTASMTREAIAQELLIDYDVALEGRVYKEFDSRVHDLPYNPQWVKYVAIDNSRGGADPHAVSVWQVNPQGYYELIDCMQFWCSIDDIAMILSGKCNVSLTTEQMAFFDRWNERGYKRGTFVSDPYDTDATVNTSTIRKIYAKQGITLNTVRCRDKLKQINIAKVFQRNVRVGEYGAPAGNAIVNSRYPQQGKNSTRQVLEPIHDQFSHYRTAFEYLATFIEETKQEDEVKKPRPLNTVLRNPNMVYRDPITGEFITNQRTTYAKR